jgi:hypothetical protein
MQNAFAFIALLNSESEINVKSKYKTDTSWLY